MKWYKASNKLSLDAGLGLIAKKANQPKYLVLAYWHVLLEIASRKEADGFIGDPDLDEISYQMDCDVSQLVTVTNVMVLRKWIVDGKIANWNDYQVDPTNKARQKAHRERQKKQEVSENVTVTNSYVTLEEKRREDTIYKDTNVSLLPAEESANDSCPYVELMKIWNEICGGAGLAKIKTVSDKRKRSMKVRWNNELCKDIETWRQFCKLLIQDTHCMGGNDRKWKASIDYALQPDRITQHFEKSEVTTGSTGNTDVDENVVKYNRIVTKVIQGSYVTAKEFDYLCHYEKTTTGLKIKYAERAESLVFN